MARKDKKQTTALGEEFAKFAGSVTGIAMLALMLIFPLFISSQSYSNILRVKYKFFWILAVVMAGLCLLAGLLWFFTDRMENRGEGARKFAAHVRETGWKKLLSAGDKGLLVFIAIALISTLTSEYLYESFWGNEGRYSGFFLLALYTVMYFLVSRFFHFKQWYLDAFLTAATLAGLFGITDYFRMDIMGYKVGVPLETADIFTSTFGNINTFTAFLGMSLAVAAGLFAVEKDWRRQLWYFLHLAVASAALITSQSDNGYLAAAALFISLPFFLFGTRTGARRYLVILAVFAAAAAWVGWVNRTMPDAVIGLAGIGGAVTSLPGLRALAALLWLAAGGWYLYDRKKGRTGALAGAASSGRTSALGAGGKSALGDSPSPADPAAADRLGPLPRRIWKWAMILIAAAVVCMFVDANLLGNGDRYGSLANFLVFDDQWGNLRGFAWRITFKDYLEEFTPLQRVFGYGPDTFGIITTTFNRMEMHYATGQIYDSAHNAYIHYFATIGPIGLGGYLVFLAGSLAAMAKHWRERPALLALFCAVLAYSAQAMVNIDLPIVTPFMWAFVAMGIACVRRSGE